MASRRNLSKSSLELKLGSNKTSSLVESLLDAHKVRYGNQGREGGVSFVTVGLFGIHNPPSVPHTVERYTIASGCLVTGVER